MKELLKELGWRGLICQYPIKNTLKKMNISLYIGFDPTSDSLHIGNIIPIFILKYFYKNNHKLLILIGGATGLIGDPSGKYKERFFLSKELLLHNMFCLKKQLEFILNIKKNIFINNYNWFSGLSFLNFIRNIGKFITINYMLTKDSVKERIDSKGISFTEFTYQLIQAYDFYHLYIYKNCHVQIGGSDQWGNIITGIELIRKLSGEIAYGITFPLIINSLGKKFGKSDNNANIWLDYKKTSPYKFYQFWIKISDKEAKRFIKYNFSLQKREIDYILFNHNIFPYKRILQKTLSKQMTKWIHGEKKYKKSLKESKILFGIDSIRFITFLNKSFIK